MNNRICGDCTLCCRGWLITTVNEQKLWPGHACHYVSKSGCTIHETRPENPCRAYKCLWLESEAIPEWMKPNEINAIINCKTINGIEFIDIKECGKKLDSSVLSWFFFKFLNKQILNLRYQLDGGYNYFGSPEFVELMASLEKTV